MVQSKGGVGQPSAQNGTGNPGPTPVQGTASPDPFIVSTGGFFDHAQLEPASGSDIQPVDGGSGDDGELNADESSERAVSPSKEKAVYILEIAEFSVTSTNQKIKLIKMTVPAGCRITYGPMVVGGGAGKFPACFRIYEGSTKSAPCIAAITGVRSFWREDIQTAEYGQKE